MPVATRRPDVTVWQLDGEVSRDAQRGLAVTVASSEIPHHESMAVLAIAAMLVASAPLCAQVMPGVGSEATTTLPRSALEDLPSSGTLGGLLETTVPELISDRIDGGGLSVGRESRLGARGGSWTQTA